MMSSCFLTIRRSSQCILVLTILTGKNYGNNSRQEFVKQESQLLLIMVDKKVLYISCLITLFLFNVIHQIDRTDACLLCFFQQNLRQNES